MKIIKHDLGPYEELNLYFLSDAHWEDANSNHKKLLQWREEVLSEENNFVIVNGDIINAATRNSVSDIYSSRSTPDKAMDEIADFLEPISDRILAIIDGNHEGRVNKESGIKPMHRLSRELSIEDMYADDAYLIFLSFGMSQGRSSRKMVYTVYGKHGSGGGKKMGGKANQLKDMSESIDSDVYVVSHTHAPIIFPGVFYRCDYRNKKVTPTEKMYVNTNAFLDYGGYGEAKGFAPASLRWPIITLNGYERIINAKF